jgi:hypothetical protein
MNELLILEHEKASVSSRGQIRRVYISSHPDTITYY